MAVSEKMVAIEGSVSSKKRDFDVLILGTGFSGLGMAIRLRQKGYRDFAVIERAQDVGGTWYANHYPGCACDVPSHVYSFSFAPNPNWTRMFSPQNEIQTYLRRCAENFSIMPHIHFGTEVLETNWDEAKKRWITKTSNGIYSSRILVAGTGALSEAKLPDFPGIEDFRGEMFHSANWNHEVDLEGKRIAVIGTGASTIQFVPEIQPKAAHLDVYMRTAPWIMPHPDRPVTNMERSIYKFFPAAQLTMRAAIFWARETFVLAFTSQRKIMKIGEFVARKHLAKQVPDPELRRKLTPNFEMGCKRVLLSNKFYPTLGKENVDLVIDPIAKVGKDSIISYDGTKREADVIIFGTGFQVAEMPFSERVRGKEGKFLSEQWKGSPRAHMGTTVPGFPNFFVLMGPNTGLGHNSMVYMIESQIAYVMDAIKLMERNDSVAIEPKQEALDQFVGDLDKKMEGTVWTSGCASWYLDSQGRNPTLWPGFSWEFRKATKKLKESEYSFLKAAL